MSVESSFGHWVRRRRKALDLTQHELARRVACAAESLRKIEADVRRPSRQLAERLAEALELPPDLRVAFIRAARAELAVDKVTLPIPPPAALPPGPSEFGAGAWRGAPERGRAVTGVPTRTAR